jgi:hypothetical protein
MKIELNPGDRIDILYENESIFIYASRQGRLAVAREVDGLPVPPFDVVDDEGAVQVRVRSHRRLAYRCADAKVGDLVRITEGIYVGYYVRVEALGRGGYSGPLCRAERVPV